MLKERVEEVLGKVRPMLQRDGGDVVLVDVQDDGIVKVKLTGACSGCPMSTALCGTTGSTATRFTE